jgi:hypothetical protein
LSLLLLLLLLLLLFAQRICQVCEQLGSSGSISKCKNAELDYLRKQRAEGYRAPLITNCSAFL